MENLLTPKKAAEILSVSPDYVWRLIREGFLPARNISSGKKPIYRIEENELDHFRSKA